MLRMRKVIFGFCLVILLVVVSGCSHKHDFAEATCLEPMKCTKCEVTEGEALGHTCEIGTCDRCGDKINYDIVMEISDKLADAQNVTNVALYMITGGVDTYSCIQNGLQYYEEAQETYKEAYDLCGNYVELRDVKNDIRDILLKLPLKVESGNQNNAVNSYLNDMTIFVTAQAKCDLTMLSVKGLFD